MTITAARPECDRDAELLLALMGVDDIRAAASEARFRLIRLARSLGIKNQAIANSLGMTEAGVRQILNRGA